MKKKSLEKSKIGTADRTDQKEPKTTAKNPENQTDKNEPLQNKNNRSNGAKKSPVFCEAGIKK